MPYLTPIDILAMFSKNIKAWEFLKIILKMIFYLYICI